MYTAPPPPSHSNDETQEKTKPEEAPEKVEDKVCDDKMSDSNQNKKIFSIKSLLCCEATASVEGSRSKVHAGQIFLVFRIVFDGTFPGDPYVRDPCTVLHASSSPSFWKIAKQ
jgi:hypothetical protein